MGAFGQALGQTFGQFGNDLQQARQNNTDRELNIALAKLQQQQIEQQMKAQQQDMQLRGAPSTTYLPTPGGGTVAAQTPAFGGPPTTTPVVPDRAAPHALSDSAIAEAAKQLPPNVNPALFTQVVTGLRDQGMYDKALEFMGKQGTPQPRIRQVDGPDPNSPTGYSRQFVDPVTSEVLSSFPIDQKQMDSTTSTTDALGFTSTSVHHKIPRPPTLGSSGSAGAPLPGSPSLGRGSTSTATPQPFATTAGVSPSRPSAAASRLQVIQQEADLWASKGIKPSGGPKEEATVSRWMAMQRPPLVPAPAGSGELTPQAQQVLMRSEPVLKQAQALIADIDKLKLGDNNTPGYLALRRGLYSLGVNSPEGTLGQDIAGLSLGSLVEATSALNAQGGGSRSLPALMIALQHTPNAWVDSPALMKEKLQTISQRLNDVINEVNEKGTKHYRPATGQTPGGVDGSGAKDNPSLGGGWEATANGPGGQIGLRKGKWYFTKTGQEYKP